MSLTEQWTAGHKAHSADAQNRIENAYRCLRIVRESFAFERVADFGCGIGGWLAAAQKLGATEIQGFEGPWIAQAETVISKDAITQIDLASAKLDLRKYYDLAISIEVAEHLPEASADDFVKMLVCASDRILFSAALPGQGGLGHVNEQRLVYWVGKFWRHHYVPLELVRPYIAGDPAIFPWLKMNLVCFVSYELFVRTPSLQRYALPLRHFDVRYPG